MTQQPTPPPTLAPALPWWVGVIVLLGALLTAAGGVIAVLRPELLLAPNQPMNAAADVYAGYLVSRNLALAVMLLALLALRAGQGARWALAGLMVFTALVQLIDAVVDATTGRAALLPILLVLAVAFFLGAARLASPALWRTTTRQDRRASR